MRLAALIQKPTARTGRRCLRSSALELATLAGRGRWARDGDRVDRGREVMPDLIVLTSMAHTLSPKNRRRFDFPASCTAPGAADVRHADRGRRIVVRVVC